MLVALAFAGFACSGTGDQSGDDDVTPRDGGATPRDGGPRDAGAGVPACDVTLDQSTACGGDIVGTWQFVGVCGRPDSVLEFEMTCPELVVTREAHTPSGRFVAHPDGTYVIDGEDNFDVDVVLPISCVEDIGGCAAFAFAVMLAIDGTATCETVADTCECNVVGREFERSDGTYTLDNGTFTASTSEGKTHDYLYCVEGVGARVREDGESVAFVIAR